MAIELIGKELTGIELIGSDVTGKEWRGIVLPSDALALLLPFGTYMVQN